MAARYRINCTCVDARSPVFPGVCGTLLCLALLSAGCSRADILSPLRISRHNAVETPQAAEDVQPLGNLERAEQALQEGARLLEQGVPSATASFLNATSLCWQVVSAAGASDDPHYGQAVAVYHQGLRQLIVSSQRFGQLDPIHGLTFDTASGPQRVPLRYHEFAWRPEDFNLWIPVADYDDAHLVRKHQRNGWGVPLVCVRQRDSQERFATRSLPFAATAILRPSSQAAPEDRQPAATFVLDVFNPLAIRSLPGSAGEVRPLAADVSAPIAWFNQNSPHLNYQAFMHPDQLQRRGQLVMLEPYQPGKIPVIFVHGLLSDPLTWNGLINELRASDWFNERYQVWLFGYSTGRPFLRSAADIRQECHAAIATLDRDHHDPALRRVVLIGHSMGGLVSKLLVTQSDTLLWSSFAMSPLECLETDQMIRQYLSELFFFEPLPFVERAIFIGTPHGGSPIAQEWMGRIASHLVTRSHEFTDEYDAFLQRNRGAIRPFFARHIPTSVDMLEPQDPVLQVMRHLPVAQHVRLHSIIGNGHTMLVGGPADGVVPIHSAHHDHVESELLVPATHRKLQTHPNTVQEVARILRLHADPRSNLVAPQIGDYYGAASSPALAVEDPT